MNPSTAPGPTQPSSALRQGGDTTWDRIQRAWPFTRIMPVIKQLPRYRLDIASHPSSNFESSGIQVSLVSVKQGNYLSQPASLLFLEIEWTILSYFPLSCFSFRLRPAFRLPTTRSPSPTWFVAAYAPATVSEHLSEPSRCMASGHQDSGRLAIQKTDNGILVIVEARPDGRSGFPGKINIGFVLVHSEAMQLRIYPSATGHRRLNVFRRTKVYPLNIDNSSELLPFRTCAIQGENGCHPSCSDFGPDHMTAERWHTLVRQWDLRQFKGNPDDSVRQQGYVGPIAD